MMVRRRWLAAAAGVAALAGAGGAVAQRQSALNSLNAVERGQWQLRDGEGSVRGICLRTPSALLQLRHWGAQCEHFVLENGGTSATIRYTCPGRGHGRTSITVETAHSVVIDTSGIVDGAPFSEQYEARRVGQCQ
ncbi:DUF3617 domain-containing protein [Sphingomonas sp. S2-65]|uniref:DUF3617 domain-containing protein n=1 Tax=Sphingomonas sp. S2-65 TaxID=2903960 RepID=UPI001F3C0F5B|nr:hypothetical protein [Sphingomonas sp. S2-65]UYY59890.1 hypothetical protein LZ586_07335 [Sphingomonas sp. S2-65]